MNEALNHPYNTNFQTKFQFNYFQGQVNQKVY